MDEQEFGARFVLNDEFSGAARRIEQQWRGLYGSLRDSVPQVDRQVSSLGESLRRLAGAALNAAAQGLRRLGGAALEAGRGVGQLAGLVGRGAAGLGGALGGLGGRVAELLPLLGIGGLVGGTVALARAAVDAGSTYQAQFAGFTRLMGSAEAAQEHLTRLRRLSAETPFEYNDLIRASQAMSGVGVAAREQERWIRAAGDAVFAVGGGTAQFMTVLERLGNMRASGRVTVDDLNAMTRAGINVRELLRDQLHLTQAQIANITTSGVQGTRAVEAILTQFERRYAGGMQAATQTIGGMVSNLKDAMSTLLVAIGRNLTPVVSGILRPLLDALTDDRIERWAHNLAAYLEVVVNIARALVSPLVSAFDDVGRGWQRGTGFSTAQLQRWLASVRLVAEGVAALLGSSDAQGVGRIPRALQQRLLAQGLWPVALRIAMWGDRVRRFLVGFVDRTVERFNALRETIARVAESLGLSHRMLSSAQAQQAGRGVADLVAGYAQLRLALMAASAATTVLTTAQAIYNAVAALNPTAWMVLGFVAFVGSVVLAVRYWDQLHARLSRMGALGSYLRLLTWPIWMWAGLIRLVIRHWDDFGRALVWVGATARAVWGGVLGYGRAVWGGVASYFRATWGGLIGWLRTFWGTVARVLAVTTRPLRFIFEGIALVAYSIWATIYRVASLAFNGLRELASSAFHAIAERVAPVLEVVRGVLVNVIEGARARFAAVRVWIATSLTAALVPVQEFFGRLAGWFTEVRRFLGSLWDGMLEGARTLVAQLPSILATVADTILSPFRWVAQQVLRLFNSLPARLRPAAVQAIANDLEGFANGGPAPVAPPGAAPAGSPALANAAAPQGSEALARASVARTAGGAGAPVVVPPPQVVVRPAPVTVTLDGAAIARVVNDHNEEQRVRDGRAP